MIPEEAKEAEPGLLKLNAGASTLSLYRRAGSDAEADRFLQLFKDDIEAPAMIRRPSDFGTLEPGRVKEFLTTLCYPATASVIGEGRCLAALDTAVSSLSEVDDSEDALNFANAIVVGIDALATGNFDQIIPGWRVQLKDLIESSMLAKGLESGPIYNLYSATLFGNEEASLQAVERAVELSPNSGDYAAKLGQIYMLRGEPDKAREQLVRAQQLLPEYRQQGIEFMLNQVQSQVGCNDD